MSGNVVNPIGTSETYISCRCWRTGDVVGSFSLRRQMGHTIRGFRTNCGYTRSIFLTCSSVFRLSVRATGGVSISFKKNMNHVHRVYKAIDTVTVLTKFGCPIRSVSSRRTHAEGCTVMRGVTSVFGRGGKAVVYHGLLPPRSTTTAAPTPTTHARRCCGGHPYKEFIKSSTHVTKEVLGKRLS